jgi:hypothetical protein
MAFQTAAFGVVCLDGLLGVAHGAELAAHLIAREDADAALVIVAEELTPLQLAAYRSVGRDPAVAEGASGVLLTRRSPSEQTGWLLGQVFEGTAGDMDAGLADWEDAYVTDCLAGPPSAIHSLKVPAMLSGMLADCDRQRAVLRTIDPSRGWRALGFERAR